VCTDAGREGSVIVGVAARNGSVEVFCSAAILGVVMCGSDGYRCSPRETNNGGCVFALSYADASG
jgi:hypothetical protein